jgi:hypothetical protein
LREIAVAQSYQLVTQTDCRRFTFFTQGIEALVSCNYSFTLHETNFLGMSATYEMAFAIHVKINFLALWNPKLIVDN